ncbi:hypothetical protein EV1_001472 [Malus domestica]
MVRTQENAWKIGLAGILFRSAVTSSLVYPLARSIPGLTGGILFLFFTTFSLSFTYFPTVAEALDELNLMTSELGQLALSSAMLNDVMQWFFMAIRYIYSHGIEALVSFVGIAVLHYLCHTADYTFNYQENTQRKRSLSVNVYSIHDWESFSKLQVLIVESYVTKFLGVTLAAMCCKIKFKHSLLLSMIMSIKGLIEPSIYSRWRVVKQMDQQSYTQIILSSLGLTMAIAPFIRSSCILHVHLRQSSSIHDCIKNIQSLLASNSETFQILCCVHNEESVRNMITLLEASNPTEASPICAYIFHAVELTGSAAPLLVPHTKQKKKFTNTSVPTNVHIMRAFENYSKNSKGPVVIEAFTMTAPYISMHETICHEANDKKVPLIIIPFHENHKDVIAPNCPTKAIRQFNINVQSYAPCTVGILVDRSLSCRLSLNHFSYNVAVFFIGGPDDREALAYSARMPGNTKVSISVFRFTLAETVIEEEQLKETKLDQALVDEFKLSNIGNDHLNWHEMEVADGVQLMDAIRQSHGDYDLVMVGRRHLEMSLRNEETVDFMENAELGVIGDMLASSDFCGGMVDVLVMQESREFELRTASDEKFNETLDFDDEYSKP